MILSGRNVLITGGSGGIGSELARALLARGARVLLTGRNHAALERTRSLLGKNLAPETVATFNADLTDASELEHLAAFARRWHGGIDVLVNNAGVSEFTLLEDASASAIEHTIATNVVAPLQLCRSLLPHLQAAASAHIVNIGSVFGAIGYPGFSVYSATKFALRGFSEALRRELAGSRVHVHYFAPRATHTGFNDDAVEAMNDALGVTADTPRDVATRICALLESGRGEATLGWPEKLFVKLNALLPGIVDGSIARQLPVIRRYARAASAGLVETQSLTALSDESTVPS